MPPKAKKCTDKEDPAICGPDKLCKVKTQRCVNDTPANRKGMEVFKYKGNTFVGEKNLIDDFKASVKGKKTPSPPPEPKKKVVKKAAKKPKTPSPPPEPKKKKAAKKPKTPTPPKKKVVKKAKKPKTPSPSPKKKPKKVSCVDTEGETCGEWDVCDVSTGDCVSPTPSKMKGKMYLELPNGRTFIGTKEMLTPIKSMLGGKLQKYTSPKAEKKSKAKYEKECADDKIYDVDVERCVDDVPKHYGGGEPQKVGKKILKLPNGKRLLGSKDLLDRIKEDIGGKYLKNKWWSDCADENGDECASDQYCNVDDGCEDGEGLDLYSTTLPNGRVVKGKKDLIEALAKTFDVDVIPPKPKSVKKPAKGKKVKAPVPEEEKKCTSPSSPKICKDDQVCDQSGECITPDDVYKRSNSKLKTPDGRVIYGNQVALTSLQKALGGIIEGTATSTPPPPKLKDIRTDIYDAFMKCIDSL